MPNIEDFRAIGTMTTRNLGKATVKVAIVLYFILLLLNIIRGTMCKFSEVLRYKYDLIPSIRSMKFCQLVYFSKC